MLDQFTLQYVNQRDDQYGGSFENRYRFAVEIVKAIKKVCGDDFPVSLRYSVVSKTKGFREGALPGEEYEEAGRDMAESEKAARVLKLRGHEPVIYEKADVLGGTFIAASAESYKGKLRDLLAWYRRQMEQLGVEIHLQTEIKDIYNILISVKVIGEPAMQSVIS